MPPTSPAPPDNTELAELVVTWSALVLTGFALLVSVLTILFVVAGFVGIRELRSIRQTGQRARKELDEQKTVAVGVVAQANAAVSVAESLSTEASVLIDRVRAAVDQTEEQSAQVRQLNDDLQGRISDLDQRVTTIVEVSYLFNQGEVAYRHGQYETAVEFLRRAVELDPKNRRVRYRLGRSLTNLSREAEAAEELRMAVEEGLPIDIGERALALLYRYSRPDVARTHALKSIEYGPQSAHNWNCVGLLRRDGGEFTDARNAHLRAAELDPTLITTPFYLALLAARAQAFQQAMDRSAAAIQLLDDSEKAPRIKSIWAAVIRWSDAVLRGAYTEADVYAVILRDTCPSSRRAKEICDHMDFLLRSLDREAYRDRYVGPVEQHWLINHKK